MGRLSPTAGPMPPAAAKWFADIRIVFTHGTPTEKAGVLAAVERLIGAEGRANLETWVSKGMP